MSFPQHESYRRSGIGWIGEMPARWGVTPIRLAARLESGHTPSRSKPEYWEDCEVPWFTLGDVWQIRDGLTNVVTETKEKVSKLGLANSAARLLPKGTVILSRTASVGFSAIMGIDMATTQDFANWVCGPTLNPKYLLYVFRAMGGEFERLRMGSTHNTIYMPDIRSMRCPLPPLDEQKMISSFLDVETSKIDGLVSEQRRLIELLKEKRQAVISHAVTKGLNPNAPMKPSGIQWLGDVPQHWEVLELKRLIKPGTSITYGIVQAGPDIEDGIPYIRTSDMSGDELPETGYLRTSTEIDESYARSKVCPGDLVVAIRASLGKGLLVPDFLNGANLTQGTAKVSPGECLTSGFLYWAFNSPYCQMSIDEVAKGTTFREITLGQLRRIRILVPEIEEQEEIVEYLADRVGRLKSLQAEAESAIELLQERRTALISAAVTGKIDVRAFAYQETA